MNVQINAVHFDADAKLLDHVSKKVEKLQTFHDRIVGVEVFLVLDNLGQQIKDKVAEIKVSIPKHTFFVKHQTKTFEESFDVAFDAMVNRIKRQKEKAMAHA